MGIHTYTCPTCQSLVRVKAQAGEVVEVESCEACKQTIAKLAGGEATPEELDRYTEAGAQRRKEKRG